MTRNTTPANPEIKRLAPGVFAIRGRTDWYTVRKGRGCSCPGFRTWGHCWHVPAIIAWAKANAPATPVWTPAVEGACGAV